MVCANVIGSCYGSTGPTSINPDTGQPYLVDFPDVTIRDTVSIHMKTVKEGIGANGVRCVIGGSMGGMQALEWLLLGQQFVKAGVVIAVGADHSAWQIGVTCGCVALLCAVVVIFTQFYMTCRWERCSEI